MLRFSFLAGRNKEVSKALRDINYAGVLVVYSWCKPGGGVLPCMAYTGMCRWTGYGVLSPTPSSPGC